MLDDSNISKLYKEICSLHGLKQVIESFTRITEKTSTLIEHICPGAHFAHGHIYPGHVLPALARGALARGAFARGAFARGALARGAFARGAFARAAFARAAFARAAFARAHLPGHIYPCTFAQRTFQLFETLSTNLVNNLPPRQTSFEWIVSVHTNQV